MEIREGSDANLAYIREALAARTSEGTYDLRRDASLALRILSFILTEGIVKSSQHELQSRDLTRREERDRYYAEPRIINFERAKAELLARRTRYEGTSREHNVEPERPRLRIFRAD